MFGHSLVADPWGRILAMAGDEICVLEAMLDKSLVKRVRSMIPMREHRRDIKDMPILMPR
jgi:predicted amidohydrolase